ncbi:MAG: hypothetical protein NVSMB66_5720 [Candidatus Doudnabacteria bacterium]
MPPRLQNLLEELYSVDPTLRSREKELKEILLVLLKTKPNIVLDQAFRENLRDELQKHRSRSSMFNNILETSKMKKFNFAFGSILFLLLLATAVNLQINKNKQNQFANSDTTQTGKITKLADNAFGGLTNISIVSSKTGLSSGMGGGGPGASAMAPVVPNDTNPSLPSSKMRIYNPVTFRYIYKGGPIRIPSDKLEVLKKADTSLDPSTLSSLLKKISFGMIDFSGFSDLNLYSYTLSQKDGYVINVNPKQGNLSIYQSQQNYICYESNAPCRLPHPNISEVPSDNELIKISNQFISDNKINISNYAAPEVINDWKISFKDGSGKNSGYIPDFGSIIYPMQINGHSVYDQSGNKIGLNVSINFPTRKVSSLSELDFSNYQSSLYKTETDLSKIMAIVEKGGLDQYPGGDVNSKTEDVQLDAPSIQWLMYWDYKNNESSLLYVPALVFPVKQASPDSNFYKKSVVVPLVQDILNSTRPPIRIMNIGPSSK